MEKEFASRLKNEQKNIQDQIKKQEAESQIREAELSSTLKSAQEELVKLQNNMDNVEKNSESRLMNAQLEISRLESELDSLKNELLAKNKELSNRRMLVESTQKNAQDKMEMERLQDTMMEIVKQNHEFAKENSHLKSELKEMSVSRYGRAFEKYSLHPSIFWTSFGYALSNSRKTSIQPFLNYNIKFANELSMQLVFCPLYFNYTKTLFKVKSIMICV